MIEIEGLRKTYGDLVAIDGLSLRAARGEILALLGPNGAGKTTTVNCLVGLLRPDAGSIRIDGTDALAHPEQAKRRLGYVPESANLYRALTPVEFLALKGRLFELPEDRIAAATQRLLEGFGLWERRHDPMVGFSKGMTQKVVLSAALLTEPRVLVLDEPLSGLDVETTMVAKELMRGFARNGGTVLYCSHLLDVVETVADRVTVLDHGRQQASGTMAELRAKAGRDGSERLEQLFQALTSATDPVARARALLGPPPARAPQRPPRKEERPDGPMHPSGR